MNKIDITFNTDNEKGSLYFRSTVLYDYFKRNAKGYQSGHYQDIPLFSYSSGLTFIDRQFVTATTKLYYKERPLLTPILATKLYSGFEFSLGELTDVKMMKTYFKDFERDVKLFYNIFVKDGLTKDEVLNPFLMSEVKQSITQYDYSNQYKDQKIDNRNVADYHRMFRRQDTLPEIKTLRTLKTRIENFKKGIDLFEKD